MATKYSPNVQQFLNNGIITQNIANEMMINTGIHNNNQKLEEYLVGEVNNGNMRIGTAVKILKRNQGATPNRRVNRVKQNCSCTISGGKK